VTLLSLSSSVEKECGGSIAAISVAGGGFIGHSVMKEAQFSRLYGLVTLVCILYFMCGDIIIFRPLIQPPNPKAQQRQLISTEDTCSSKFCPNLFFLSGIYDVINFDMRFTSPFEDHDPNTLFGKASFSEYALARVKKFSSFEFYLSSNTDKNSRNTIGGSYNSENIVNGSAMIVVSEFPGREMWFHADTLLNADCLNDTTSLIIFANALNSQMNFFTKTPEGNCQKLEMEDDDTSPLSYCQARSGFVWEIFTDWKCSSQIIASDYINGGLGTVYSVIIGNNLSSADLITLSTSSSFVGVTSPKEPGRSYPSFFQRNMMIFVLSAGLGALGLLFVFYLGARSQQPAVAGFREGDIVVYQLTKYQINMLQHNDSKKLGSRSASKKTKGFALIVRAPPAGFFAKISSSASGWLSLGNHSSLSPKFVLQLQPLKKVLRTETQSASEEAGDANSQTDDFASLELMIDDYEAPLSINQWGLRGGRILLVISTSNIHRRSIYVGDASAHKKTSVRFSERPASASKGSGEINETEILTWMDCDETECLLTNQDKRIGSPLRNRKGRSDEMEVVLEEDEEKDDHPNDSSLVRFCRRILSPKGDKSLEDDIGSGWIFPTGEDSFFLLDDASASKSVEPHLKKSSFRYESVRASGDDNLPPGLGYSYLLTNLPSKVAGEKIQRIHCREWVYPFSKDGRLLKREKSSRRQFQREASLGSQNQVPSPGAPDAESASPAAPEKSIETPKIKRAKSKKGIGEEKVDLPPVSPYPKTLVKASSQAENLLNVIIKEYEPLSPNENSNLDSPDVSQFVASPQPISVRIALRRELSRKNRPLLPSITSNSSPLTPPPVFTSPRLLTSPLPVIRSEPLKLEEISSPSSPVPMQSYFVTPPRSDSTKSRKTLRQMSAELYSQTNKKSKNRSVPLASPNSSPQLNPGTSVTSSATTIPTSQPIVNADREVNTGFGSLDKVVTGSKLEIDDEENEKEEQPVEASKSKGRKQGIVSTIHSRESKPNNHRSQSPQKFNLLPVIASPRQLSRPISRSPAQPPPQTFTASPKTLPVRNSPKRTLSARKSAMESRRQIETIEWEDDELEHHEQNPQIVRRLSSKFEMDLSFLPDPNDSA
jgi:hypothetical protein